MRGSDPAYLREGFRILFLCGAYKELCEFYEKLDKKTTRWLYQQERGFVEGMRDVSLKEIARQRIDEFTTTLRKYIL